MSAHTPGPWRQSVDRGIEQTTIVSAGGLLIGYARWDEYGRWKANARLIAAAPDLAFHLLAAANYIDTLGGDSRSYRQAIARATGAAQ